MAMMRIRCSLAVLVVLLLGQGSPVISAGGSAADKLKEGDMAVAQGHNNAAVRHYTDALSIDNTTSLIYTKRAAAYVGLNKLKDAISDLGKAIQLDPKMVQALLNRGRLYRQLGRFNEAQADFESITKQKPTHKAALQEIGILRTGKDAYEGAKRHLSINDFRGAQLKLKVAQESMPDFPDLLLLQSHMHYKQQDYNKVVADLGKLLKIEPGNMEALALRGWSYLYLGDEETGTRHFREVLRYDPEQKEAKESYKKIKSITKLRGKAQAAMESRDNRGAETFFLEAVQIEPALVEINLPMYRELCRIQLMIGKSKEAIGSCDAALQRNPELTDCSINKVKAMLKLEQYEEAANLARYLAQTHRGNGQIHQLLQEAERLLKMSKRKDYYKVLGVDKRADAATIKRQYRQLAKKYHPDKQQGDEAQKAEAENKFREVAEAYEVLSDPEKRSRFDRGEDLDQPQGHSGGPGFHHGGFHFRY